MAIVTGSFTMSGNGEAGAGLQYPWSMDVRYQTTGSFSMFNYGEGNATTKNSMVGFQLGNYVAPFNQREIAAYVSGSNVATNPPNWAFGPNNLGYTLTLSGQGIIRGFGLTSGNTSLQSQYNCIYETTPSK
jgi:hypothetical protein